MTKQDLLDRIQKKEIQIEKLDKKIKKYKALCSQEEINICEEHKNSYKNFVIAIRDNDYNYSNTSELRNALLSYDDAVVTLNKYKNKLNIIIEQEGAAKIPVLVEFFNGYKARIIKLIKRNVEYLEEYYAINHKRVDMFNSRRSFIADMGEEAYNLEYKRLKEKEEELWDYINPLTKDVYNLRERDIDYDKLNNILDKDIENKYWNMIEKVTKFTGEITDASNVSVAGDGNLNGIIIGKDGKAKLETILAGGYNQDIIVNYRHGQILHYRLLVKPC